MRSRFDAGDCPATDSTCRSRNQNIASVRDARSSDGLERRPESATVRQRPTDAAARPSVGRTVHVASACGSAPLTAGTPYPAIRRRRKSAPAVTQPLGRRERDNARRDPSPTSSRSVTPARWAARCADCRHPFGEIAPVAVFHQRGDECATPISAAIRARPHAGQRSTFRRESRCRTSSAQCSGQRRPRRTIATSKSTRSEDPSMRSAIHARPVSRAISHG